MSTSTHLGDTAAVPPAATPDGCEECRATGSRWVHLRQCTACGHVGCCYSSPNTHATAHFRVTEHPVIRSYELGEAWRWCYVDSETGRADAPRWRPDERPARPAHRGRRPLGLPRRGP